MKPRCQYFFCSHSSTTSYCSKTPYPLLRYLQEELVGLVELRVKKSTDTQASNAWPPTCITVCFLSLHILKIAQIEHKNNNINDVDSFLEHCWYLNLPVVLLRVLLGHWRSRRGARGSARTAGGSTSAAAAATGTALPFGVLFA